MEQQYTNELTPDVLACQDVSPFSPEQLAEMSDEARALIGFINRPDEQWKRSVYSMDGKKV